MSNCITKCRMCIGWKWVVTVTFCLRGNNIIRFYAFRFLPVIFHFVHISAFCFNASQLDLNFHLKYERLFMRNIVQSGMLHWALLLCVLYKVKLTFNWIIINLQSYFWFKILVDIVYWKMSFENCNLISHAVLLISKILF